MQRIQASNKTPRRWLPWCLASILVLVALGIIALRPRPPALSTVSWAPAVETNASNNLPSQTIAARVPEQASWFEQLKSAPDAETARRRLEEWRTALTSMPRPQAIRKIQELLATHVDASTRLGFKLGSDGALLEAPTMRTFLLDLLEHLDPAAAAESARGILADKTSADEWAIALRSLARGDTSAEGRALLQVKFGEMLRHQPWQRELTTGFLESFDVAVFLGSPQLLPGLSELVRRKDDAALARASFLALDRMTINDPVTTLTALQSAPDWMAGREETRANYFARGDVRDPAQRRLLEEYLMNPALGSRELEAFAGVFPNANFMISMNLLTQNRTMDAAAIIARDVESRHVVEQWLTDPRFARVRPALETISRRLEIFARQGEKMKP